MWFISSTLLLVHSGEGYKKPEPLSARQRSHPQSGPPCAGSLFACYFVLINT